MPLNWNKACANAAQFSQCSQCSTIAFKVRCSTINSFPFLRIPNFYQDYHANSVPGACGSSLEFVGVSRIGHLACQCQICHTVRKCLEMLVFPVMHSKCGTANLLKYMRNIGENASIMQIPRGPVLSVPWSGRDGVRASNLVCERLSFFLSIYISTL